MAFTYEKAKPVGTQLLVIDCKSFKVNAYEGAEKVDSAQLTVDDDTDPKELRTLLEDFRVISTIQSRDARGQAERIQQELNTRNMYADMEWKQWMNWFPENSPVPVV